MISTNIFTEVINSYIPEPHASLLNGILFGVPLKSAGPLYEQLKVVGLLHMVVLSGMNITFLAAFIGKATSMFSKQVSILITIVSIIFFIVFVGAEAPIVRAGIMGCLTLVSILLGRKTIALYGLFTSGFLIALFKPDWLATVSFQLSFAATLGIILFGGSRNNKKLSADLSNASISGFTPVGSLPSHIVGTGLPSRSTDISALSASNSLEGKDKTESNSRSVIGGYIKDNLRISLAAQVFTAPIIFFYFREISFVSPLANILVAWTIEPLMILGFIASLAGKIWWPLGLVPSWLCYGLLNYYLTIVNILYSIPFASMKL
ncbi:MAG TPA: ComEC/Rec2 family competence protein [Candidatus Nitrosocosmicus sp.]|nr:ComEC/Rec2 family competence protein [Candidatus Nitrosocosmicus sp.]